MRTFSATLETMEMPSRSELGGRTTEQRSDTALSSLQEVRQSKGGTVWEIS